jgi:hypothetical protein
MPNVPASGKVVYIKKLRCKIFLIAPCWLRKKLSRRYRVKEHLPLCILELEVAAIISW